MKNLRLIPDIHRQQHIVKANFAFDKELIALVKRQTGVRWSQTLKCWYFSKADFNLNTFYKNFEGSTFIDYSQLKQQSDLIKKTTIKIAKEYLEQLEGSYVLKVQDNGVLRLSLGDDYKASTSLPGLYIYLGNNPNSIADAYEIGAVTVFQGAHFYDLPESIGLYDNSYILYWCKPFGVKVGEGKIQ